jgi:hypothetical protein
MSGGISWGISLGCFPTARLLGHLQTPVGATPYVHWGHLLGHLTGVLPYGTSLSLLGHLWTPVGATPYVHWGHLLGHLPGALP